MIMSFSWIPYLETGLEVSPFKKTSQLPIMKEH